jgi:hypothetical protein
MRLHGRAASRSPSVGRRRSDVLVAGDDRAERCVRWAALAHADADDQSWRGDDVALPTGGAVGFMPGVSRVRRAGSCRDGGGSPGHGPGPRECQGFGARKDLNVVRQCACVWRGVSGPRRTGGDRLRVAKGTQMNVRSRFPRADAADAAVVVLVAQLSTEQRADRLAPSMTLTALSRPRSIVLRSRFAGRRRGCPVLSLRNRPDGRGWRT